MLTAGQPLSYRLTAHGLNATHTQAGWSLLLGSRRGGSRDLSKNLPLSATFCHRIETAPRIVKLIKNCSCAGNYVRARRGSTATCATVNNAIKNAQIAEYSAAGYVKTCRHKLGARWRRKKLEQEGASRRDGCWRGFGQRSMSDLRQAPHTHRR